MLTAIQRDPVSVLVDICALFGRTIFPLNLSLLFFCVNLLQKFESILSRIIFNSFVIVKNILSVSKSEIVAGFLEKLKIVLQFDRADIFSNL